MPSCLILGDSLAVGVSQHLPQCEVHAKVGAQTNSFIGSGIHVNQWFSDTALVSLGSNDSGSPAIQYDVLRKFRKTLTANRVFWILPNNNWVAREAIKEVSKEFGDFLIDARNYERSPDKVHPTGKAYKEIASAVPLKK
jgi:lysophospholipase L1-like esterase